MLNYRKYKDNPTLPPDKLIVMFHGYGSNKDDLIHISPELSQFAPNALFLSPESPFHFEGRKKSKAKQWFSLHNRSKDTLLNEIKIIEPYVTHFIAEQLKKYNISDDNLCLLGFSQGTILSLHLVMQELIKPKLVIGYSGKILCNYYRCGNDYKKTKIMLIHGKDDNIISSEETLSATKELREYGFNTQNFISNNLGHGIDSNGINISGKFLQDHF